MATVSFPVCPGCSSRLRGGWPSFGPSQVKCGYCGTSIDTRLVGWNEGPFSSPLRKVGLVLTEILVPTCMGYKEPVPRFLLNLLWLLPTFLLPVLPVLRLVKMINESKSYDKTKVSPEWKWLYRQIVK
jgi:hypothetical protein